jgi:hypothetical protein
MVGRCLLPFVVALTLATPLGAVVRGVVVSSEGTPLKGIAVRAHIPEATDALHRRLHSDKPQRAALLEAQTDERGMFALDVKGQPTVVVTISETGWRSYSQLVSAEDDLGTIGLKRVESRSGKVTAGGKPVATARVVLYRLNGPELHTTTDDQGRYTIPDPQDWIMPGALRIFAPGFAPANVKLTSRPGSLDVRLQPGVRLTGRTLSDDGKTPLPKAELWLDGWPVGSSGDDSSYALDGLPSDWRQLVAIAGSKSGVRTNTPNASGDIRVGKATTLTVTLRDGKSQKPLASSLVGLSEGEGFTSVAQRQWVTDGKGTVVVTGMPPSKYRVIVNSPDHSALPVDVSLRPAEQAARTVLATPVARISGVVRDELKKPVAGATVQPRLSRNMPPGPIMMRSLQMGSTVTAPDGTFILRNIEPDTTFEIGATKKGLPDARQGPYQLAAAERKSGVVITLPSGLPVVARVTNAAGDPIADAVIETSPSRGNEPMTFVMRGMSAPEGDQLKTDDSGSISFRLSEGSYDISARAEGFAPKSQRAVRVTAAMEPVTIVLDRAVSVSGRLVRSDGTGVADASVSTFGPGSSSSVLTAPDGSFTLTGLAPGPVMLDISKQEELIQDNRQVKAPTEGLEIVIDTGGIISGRVTDKSTKGAISDFRIGVSGDRSGGGIVIRRPPSLKPIHSDDGTFTVDHLPTGAVDVVVDAPGYVQTTLGGLEIPKDKPLRDVEIALEPAVRVVGKVTGPDGAPLSGVTVGPEAEGIAFMLRGSVTDAGGEYVLDGQAAGEVVLAFSKSGFSTERKITKLSGREMRVDARLATGKPLLGVVVDESGRPLADVAVSAVTNMRRPATASTDANGNFRIEGLDSGRYLLRAGKSGYVPAEQPDVDLDTAGSVRLVLKAGAVVVGRVTGLSPEEMSNVTVFALGSQGSRPSMAQADANGQFRIEGAPTGSVRVWAASGSGFMGGGGRTSERKSIEVASGGETAVDIEFLSGNSVSGTVTREGRPLAGVEVLFDAADRRSSSRASAISDSGGRYEVTGLEDGEYDVVVRMSNFSTFNTKHLVSGSGNFDIRVPTAALRGVVTDATTGDPIEGAAVDVNPKEGESIWLDRKMTSATGAFRFDSLAAGSYAVRVSKSGYGQVVRPVEVGEETSDVEISMEKSEGVVVSIVDGRDGRPLSSVVRATDASGAIVFDRSLSPRPDGSVTVPLAPGNYRLRVVAMNLAPAEVSVTAPGRGPRIALTPGGSLEILSRANQPTLLRLLNASGQPALGAGVDRGELAAAPGASTVRHVAPGAYSLQVLGEGNRIEKTMPVTIVEGQTTRIEI